MSWNFYLEKFEYEESLNDCEFPWSGHKYFAYDLVRNIKPKKIVELGTFKGTSFFSFCQAVKDGDLDCEIFAVDTWAGDDHSGFYGDEIYKSVCTIRDQYYFDVKTQLIRKTFDEAVSEFSDGSVDVLHIDGLHTYEAVKHDFENWLPKVKSDGIILFHDTVVTKDDFGVFLFWKEVKKQYENIEFMHSYGLGVISKSSNSNKRLFGEKEFLEMHYSFLVKEKESFFMRSLRDVIRKKDREIDVVKSSKFWKMRKIYVKLKGFFRELLN